MGKSYLEARPSICRASCTRSLFENSSYRPGFLGGEGEVILHFRMIMLYSIGMCYKCSSILE